MDHEVTMAPGEIIGLFVRANPTLGAANFNVSCEDGRLTAIEVQSSPSSFNLHRNCLRANSIGARQCTIDLAGAIVTS